jgi:hypothetical protein
VYLLVQNRKLRDVISALSSKSVLILGRFTEERKPILDALRDQLRARDMLPIVFDWEPSASRDLTETVQLLGGGLIGALGVITLSCGDKAKHEIMRSPINQ